MIFIYNNPQIFNRKIIILNCLNFLYNCYTIIIFIHLKYSRILSFYYLTLIKCNKIGKTIYINTIILHIFFFILLILFSFIPLLIQIPQILYIYLILLILFLTILTLILIILNFKRFMENYKIIIIVIIKDIMNSMVAKIIIMFVAIIEFIVYIVVIIIVKTIMIIIIIIIQIIKIIKQGLMIVQTLRINLDYYHFIKFFLILFNCFFMVKSLLVLINWGY